jgi:two-component system OmpR family response regulator
MSPAPRVALIDHDRAWTEALADYLEGKGFRVVTAADGAAGLELLAGGQVAAAVLDWDLPGRSGPELLRDLRRRGLAVAVVLVSGDERPGRDREAHEAGAFAYLPKTASPALLHQALQQALRAGEPRPPALLPAPREQVGP